jgi:hypothetical protein
MATGTSVWWGATLAGVGESCQKVGVMACRLTSVLDVPVPGGSMQVLLMEGCVKERRESKGQHS